MTSRATPWHSLVSVIDRIGTVLAAVWMFAARTWMAALVIVAADLLARRGRRLELRPLLRALHRPLWQAMLIAAGVSLVVSLSVFAVRGEPLPNEQDERNHLLVADTLRHGRLANPSHPMWRQLEDPIAIHYPVYASKYPIGNGLLLVFGEIVFGLPIAGIWIASAAAAAAMVWAARAWLTPSWSLLAGLAFALHPTFTDWNTAYQRGSLPAFAAALLLGAAARLCRRPSSRLMAIAATALMILAISRPFEGLVYAIGVGLFVVIRAPRKIALLARKSAIAIPIVAAGFTLIAMHNRAVTGSVFEHPHLLHDRQYERAPNFVWQPPYPPKTYRSEELRGLFAGSYWSFYQRLTAPGGWWRVGIVEKFLTMGEIAFPPPSSRGVIGSAYALQFAPLVVLPWSLRRRRTRLLLLILLSAAIAPLLFVQPVLGQYIAPATAAATILYVLLARELVARFPARGAMIVFATIAFCLPFAIQSAIEVARKPQPAIESNRRAIVAQLERVPGKDLILVPPNIFNCVYNAADVDAAPVVWARQLGPGSDAELLHYFRDRHPWQLVRAAGGLAVKPAQRSVQKAP